MPAAATSVKKAAAEPVAATPAAVAPVVKVAVVPVATAPAAVMPVVKAAAKPTAAVPAAATSVKKAAAEPATAVPAAATSVNKAAAVPAAAAPAAETRDDESASASDAFFAATVEAMRADEKSAPDEADVTPSVRASVEVLRDAAETLLDSVLAPLQSRWTDAMQQLRDGQNDTASDQEVRVARHTPPLRRSSHPRRAICDSSRPDVCATPRVLSGFRARG